MIYYQALTTAVDGDVGFVEDLVGIFAQVDNQNCCEKRRLKTGSMMATQTSDRMVSLVSTSTTSSRSSTESFLDLVKSSLEAAAWVQKTSKQIYRPVSTTTVDAIR